MPHRDRSGPLIVSGFSPVYFSSACFGHIRRVPPKSSTLPPGRLDPRRASGTPVKSSGYVYPPGGIEFSRVSAVAGAISPPSVTHLTESRALGHRCTAVIMLPSSFFSILSRGIHVNLAMLQTPRLLHSVRRQCLQDRCPGLLQVEVRALPAKQILQTSWHLEDFERDGFSASVTKGWQCYSERLVRMIIPLPHNIP